MKIVILGAGKTGAYTAQVLSTEQHDVILVDKDPKVLEQISREADVGTLLAKMPCISAITTLLEMKPDIFFATTGDDETNLISCALAKNLGIPKTIARVKSRCYLQTNTINIGRLFYVDLFIGAEMLCASELFRLITHSADAAYQHFAHGSILMRTVKIPDEWKKKEIPIKNLSLPGGLIAGLIRREEETLFPHGEDCIQPKDQVTLLGQSSILNQLHSLFQIREKRIHSTVIVGGSDIATHLAHLLLEQHIAVKIIEKNEERCRELSDLLPRALILNRDGRDFAALSDENVGSADACVSCTEDEGSDYLIASMAVQLGCQKSIALVGSPSSIPIFEKAGITVALSSRVNIVNRILAFLHNSTISVSSLSNDQAKIVELKVSPASKLIGKPLADLHLPKDLLIATIENHGNVMIASGSSILCPDDTVVAICSPHRLEQLQHLFL